MKSHGEGASASTLGGRASGAGGRSFPCPICGKTFTKKLHLKEHMRQHLTQVKNVYVVVIKGKVMLDLTLTGNFGEAKLSTE